MASGQGAHAGAPLPENAIEALASGRPEAENGVRPARERIVSDTVEVEIFDHTYHLRGDLDQAHADALAQYVDARMRAIAEGTRTVDSVRVAVLASLHIAAELFDLRERHQALEGQIRERAERALTLVDRAFEKSA